MFKREMFLGIERLRDLKSDMSEEEDKVAQKPVLGKGLASLFPGANSGNPPAGASAAGTPMISPPPLVQDAAARDRHLGISVVTIDEIHANHFQPRRDFDEAALQELAQSIKVNGIIQPLVVRKNSKGDYELIAGERRWRAARMAGLKQVPIVIRKSTDRETLELALVENIQRQNLNCIDEALAYFQLIEDFSLTQEEVADRVGKDRATVANYLRLLRLPEVIIDDLRKQILSFGHGKALLALDDSELRLRARKQIIEKKLSVRETEALVESLKKGKEQGSSSDQDSTASPTLNRLTQLSRELARYWATQVDLKGDENRGKIVIHYSSRQELDRILEGMQNGRI